MLPQYVYDTSAVAERLLLGYTPDPATRKQQVSKELQKLENVIRANGGGNAAHL
jgi:hypothetical protein